MTSPYMLNKFDDSDDCLIASRFKGQAQKHSGGEGSIRLSLQARCGIREESSRDLSSEIRKLERRGFNPRISKGDYISASSLRINDCKLQDKDWVGQHTAQDKAQRYDSKYFLNQYVSCKE